MSATLVIAGDLCTSGSVGQALCGPTVESVWGDIAQLNREADFSIVNLECPLTDRPEPIVKSGPALWGPPRAAQGIRAGGFTAASLANNHIMDAGSSGLVATMQACRDAGLAFVGAGANHEAATQPLTTDVAGLTLSVLAVAENEFSTTTGAYHGAWPFDLVDNARQIAKARRASDYVLVLVHGGTEYHPLPSPRLQKACRFFVEQGADAVVCHHSHVPGGYERYQGRPIVYGIGNLLFDPGGVVDDRWFDGYLVRLRAGRAVTLDFQLIPYRQDPAGPSLRLAQGVERETFLAHLEQLSSIVRDAELLKGSWIALCRERQPYLETCLLCLTKAESWLLDKHLLPSVRFRLRGRRLTRLLNLFSCESLEEASEQVLRDILQGRRPGA